MEACIETQSDIASQISPHAVISPTAKIADNVSIGAFSVIGDNVEIGEGTWIGSHVVIAGPTKIGRDNQIHPYASVGGDSQDKKYAGETSRLEIGDCNTIREFCTLNRGTESGGGVTRIGNDNLMMAYVHIAHDCQVGNHCVLSNNATLGGHVVIGDYVGMAGFSAVHQFCQVGAHSFIAKASMITKDVLPYILVDGNPPSSYGLNSIGLKRRQFSDESIDALREAYKVVFRRGLTVTEAASELKTLAKQYDEVAQFKLALEHATRGIVR